MFITGGQRSYTRSGEQKRGSGSFVILVSCDELPLNKDNFRACVVRMHMEQCGHWVMGNAMIQGKRFTLSGAYGADGLTMTVPKDVFDGCVPVPEELYEMWAHSEGHNTCGREAVSVKEWALANIKELRKAAR